MMIIRPYAACLLLGKYFILFIYMFAQDQFLKTEKIRHKAVLALYWVF